MIDVKSLPKAELHLHIEGTLEPELALTFAERNHIRLSFDDPATARAAYNFKDRAGFSNLYAETQSVLRTERDFEELTVAYLQRAQSQNVRHAEVFFDPQCHMERGVPFDVVIDGIWSALSRSRHDFGITTVLIMSFMRDRPQRSALEALELALPYQDRIIGVGLDSSETENPPAAFVTVFEQARTHGFLAVAHAGEMGPPAYIWQALDDLRAVRIDHGIRCLEDAELTNRLQRTRMPLTICPLSNVRMRVVDSLAHHPLKRMLAAGLMVSVNSGDPAYVGGYVTENYAAVAAALRLSDDDLLTLARNSFASAFLDDGSRWTYYEEIAALSNREESA